MWRRLRDEDRFRFANELRAFVAVDGSGQIADCGYAGRGLMGTTLVNLRAVKHRFQAVQLPTIQREPEYGDGWVRFVQTCGGRTGVPAPRRVRRRPFVQWQAPLVWTTLSLTLHADGRAGAHARRREQVPPALGLRRREQALAQVGPDRLQGLVPQVVRQAQPLGRRRLRGPGLRGRVRPRDLALGPADAGRRQAAHRAVPGRDDPVRRRASRAPRSC